MRIGILGGTFDPIHLGHLRAAELARESLDLERVLVVPAHVPPHRARTSSHPRDRYAMAALAVAGNRDFEVSSVELEREGPSFTVDTLRELQRRTPGVELVLIVGSDTFTEMPTWREHEAVFSLATVAVVGRPGASASPDGVRAVGVEGASLPISATDIRRRVGEGRSIRYLVPDAVADFVAKQGLYR
jgi:nicotinate-nucleotide adenylyltransferase